MNEGEGAKKDGRSSKCLLWFETDVDTVLNSEFFIFVSLEINIS